MNDIHLISELVLWENMNLLSSKFEKNSFAFPVDSWIRMENFISTIYDGKLFEFNANFMYDL